ncbi:MAG: hypothetical protein ACT4PO_01445 [Actinomycetota bacterium]
MEFYKLPFPREEHRRPYVGELGALRDAGLCATGAERTLSLL